MNMSSPALIAAAQLSGWQPGTWAWPFQSPTTKPSKPIRPFSALVSSSLLPWFFTPCQLE